MLTLRDCIRKFGPSWITDRVLAGFTVGYRYLYAIAYVGDLLLQFAIEGARAKFPGLATSGALRYIGRDRKIRRGDAESDDGYRARLLTWLQDWKRAGSAYAIMSQIAGYLVGEYFTIMRIVNANGTWWTVELDGSHTRTVTLPSKNWNWDGEDSRWARFWPILYSPFGVPWVRDGTWGDGGLWGDDPDEGWGSTATLDQVSSIRAIVKDWKSAEAVCPFIVISFDGAAFDPTAPPGVPLPDGTWGSWHKWVAGSAVPSRDPNALYWAGTP